MGRYFRVADLLPRLPLSLLVLHPSPYFFLPTHPTLAGLLLTFPLLRLLICASAAPPPPPLTLTLSPMPHRSPVPPAPFEAPFCPVAPLPLCFPLPSTLLPLSQPAIDGWALRRSAARVLSSLLGGGGSATPSPSTRPPSRCPAARSDTPAKRALSDLYLSSGR